MMKKTILLLVMTFVLSTSSMVSTIRDMFKPELVAEITIAETAEDVTEPEETVTNDEKMVLLAGTADNSVEKTTLTLEYELTQELQCEALVAVEETTHEEEQENEETIPDDQEIEEPEPYKWEGDVLTARKGTVQGPNGKETWYNLDMTGVIWLMEAEGYYYEYSVREDGVKMYGDYIMCAANLNIFPRGTILETSLGTAMVCDSCALSTQMNSTQLDIAVTWR